jgi:hypothetical protein
MSLTHLIQPKHTSDLQKNFRVVHSAKSNNNDELVTNTIESHLEECYTVFSSKEMGLNGVML